MFFSCSFQPRPRVIDNLLHADEKSPSAPPLSACFRHLLHICVSCVICAICVICVFWTNPIVLVAVVASVPLDSSKNHRSKESSLRNQLFDMASLNKRSMVNLPYPMRMQQPQEQPEEPEEWYPEEK